MHKKNIMSEHLFPYKWTLKDAVFTKDKGKVFSCFAGGGGSTMGYKLAGFDVIGCNEIDPKMMACYVENHKPKYSFLEPIQTFKLRKDLPADLYDLDILDGSPPCSSFSMSGNREKDWGKEKIFTEGQSLQILDTLFFDFIELAKELKPKIVIAENVKGLLLGNAKSYVIQIYKDFEKAGYYCQHFLLNASKMGVPQQRERVFFVCIKKELAIPFLYQKNLFQNSPKIDFTFNEKPIKFGEITEVNGIGATKMFPSILKHWNFTKPGNSFSDSYKNETKKSGWFNYVKTHPNKVLYTISAHINGGGEYHFKECRSLSKSELLSGGSFPIDYDFKSLNPKYIIGMSVPPLITAQIATRIYDQWLSKL